MKRLTLTLSALFFLLATCLWPQTGLAQKTDFPVPKKYKLKKKEDYYRYEKDILATTEWLANTYWGDKLSNKDLKQRQKALLFIMEWGMGCPQVTINIYENMLPSDEDEDIQLLVMYMAGWIQHALTHPDEEIEEAERATYAMEYVIRFYEKNRGEIGVSESDFMDELVKTLEKGKLKDWVIRHMREYDDNAPSRL